LYIREIPIQLN